MSEAGDGDVVVSTLYHPHKTYLLTCYDRIPEGTILDGNQPISVSAKNRPWNFGLPKGLVKRLATPLPLSATESEERQEPSKERGSEGNLGNNDHLETPRSGIDESEALAWEKIARSWKSARKT